MISRLIATWALLASAATAGDRAIVIGIDDYSLVRPDLILTGAVNDADRFGQLLTGQMGFAEDEVVTLTNGAAGSDAILSRVIDTLVGETEPGDRAVLYFAGMGTVLPDGERAILAHDGASVLGRIPLSTLSEILSVISDRDVTVVLDAGFNGGATGLRGVTNPYLPNALAFAPGVTLWMASDLEGGWEVPGSGVFTRAFTEAAASASSNAEILSQVETSLSTWCDAEAACSDWTPVFRGDESAQLAALPVPPAPEPIDAPPEMILVDDGAPASFKETLGFVVDLFAPSNAADLTLDFRGSEDLRIGQFVTMTASSTRPGTLLLLDVDPVGQLAQVYPSRLSGDGASTMVPGETLVIPSTVGVNGKPLRIRVKEPAGQGLLLGLFIEGDLPQLTALLPAGIDGGPIDNASQSLFQISQALLRAEADPDNPVAWSATYLPYRIDF